MANSLSAFLAQNAKKVENKKFVLSDRFVDPETGEPMEWEICAISANAIKKLRQDCMRNYPMPGGKKGQFIQQLDSQLFQLRMSAKCTVFPDLNSPELQGSYGVMDDESLLGAMLIGGEFDELYVQVQELCGYELQDNLVEEAKN